MLPFLPSRRALFGGVAIMGGGPPAKTYADWVAHIAVAATGGTLGWGTNNIAAGTYRTTAASATGVLFGSPWLSNFAGGPGSATISRLVQHCLPSEGVYNEQIAGGRELLFRIAVIGSSTTFSALNRNGFLSSSFSGTTLPQSVVNLTGWWDETTQTALMNNPQAGTGPVPYVAAGW